MNFQLRHFHQFYMVIIDFPLHAHAVVCHCYIMTAYLDYHPICEKIEILERRFCSLGALTLEELTDRAIDVKQIRMHIMSLPDVAGQVGDHALQIRQKLDRDRLFVYLDATIWNFIDYTLLEHIIRLFGSVELRRKMERYVADFTQFSKQTTVSQLIMYWPGRKDTPPNYCELTVKISMDPDHCTLEQLDILRKDMCKQFLPPLSEFALLFWKFGYGSTVVKFFTAIDLIPSLMSEVKKPESKSFFMVNSIDSIQIRDVVLYPDPTQPSSHTDSDIISSDGKLLRSDIIISTWHEIRLSCVHLMSCDWHSQGFCS